MSDGRSSRLPPAFEVGAWKSFDWESMNRLYEAGLITDPRSKAKSVILTEEGAQRARELFSLHFGRDPEP